jgi:NAD(P)-dependent dehydrogenase (short-subunit alcohol dehydrogenase family)
MPTSTRVAAVTGAAGSIGSRLVARLEEDGWTVVGLELAERCPPGDDRFLSCDVTDADAVATAVEQLLDRYGRLDLLVNNAGVSAIGSFLDHDVSVHRRVMEVDHLGVVALTQAVLPELRRTGGRIVVIGSVTGFAPVLGRPAYVAAKHAVTGLFEALRPELARDGVGVTLVHPTHVTGGMGEAAGRAEGSERATTGAEVTPDDVAVAVVEGVRRGRDRVLVGRIARLSWHVNRLAPGTYVRLMTRRLRRDGG